MADTLYIIDKSKPFDGSVLNTMPHVFKDSRHGADILNSTYVHYTDGVTFAQYNEQHGGNLIALTWEEFCQQYYTPYLTAMQKDFEETTAERFENALDELPPVRWTRQQGSEFFFLGECYQANLYRVFVRIGSKYYTAVRAIDTPAEALFSLQPVK